MAVEYNPSIVTKDLFLCLDAANYRSYPGSGTAWKELVSQANATLTSGPTYSAANGGVITYDGTDDSTTLPLAAFPSTSLTEVTVSIWQKNLISGNRSSFFAKDSSGTRTLNAHIPWGDNIVYWDAGGAGSYDRISKTTTKAERDGWHNWVFTKNSSTTTLRIYLDGVQWHSGNGGAGYYSVGVPTAAYLGSGDSTAYYQGDIAHFSIYSRELSAGEILQNYNALKGRYGL